LKIVIDLTFLLILFSEDFSVVAKLCHGFWTGAWKCRAQHLMQKQ